MSGETWVLYRHKKRPDIRYYVEMHEEPQSDWSVSLAPKPYYTPGNEPGTFEEEFVHIKAPSFPPEMAPEAGMWPYGRFMELYEKEEGK